MEEGKRLNSLSEASITLTLKPDKDAGVDKIKRTVHQHSL